MREARMKVSSTFSKVAGCRGRALARAPQSAELSCAHKSAGGGLRGNPRRGFPLILRFCVCAVSLGSSLYPLLPFDPISLVLAQRNGVEPPKKSAFLPRRLHHSRERSCLGYLYSSSPDLGEGLVVVLDLYVCAVSPGKSRHPLLPIPPHFFALAQRNGVEPQRNALMGAATGHVRSHPPLPRTRSPNITADCVKLTLPGQFTHRVQINLTHQFVPLGLTPKWERRVGPPRCCGGFKALFFGGSTPFLWASTKEMGSNGRASQRPPPNVSAHPYKPKRKQKGGNPRRGFPLGLRRL